MEINLTIAPSVQSQRRQRRNNGPRVVVLGLAAAIVLIASPSARSQGSTNYTGGIPIFQYAVFYQNLLEFTWDPPMTVGGRVHANGDIYVGSSSSLLFQQPVTAEGAISDPPWDGKTVSQYTGTVTYNGMPGYVTNVPAMELPIGTNPPSALGQIIQMPPAGEDPNSDMGRQRYYNKAAMILIVSNTTVTTILQQTAGDPSPATKTVNFSTNNYSTVSTNFPFLSLTNYFADQREEGKVVRAAQIDIGQLNMWLLTNNLVLGKFGTNGSSGAYPNILYVADDRTDVGTTNGTELYAVRLTNCAAIPTNGGTGFTIATPNPLYVWGNYNATGAGTGTNYAGTQPASLVSDALTILSSSWKDSASSNSYGPGTRLASASTTINAAMITGQVYSTGPALTQYGGGFPNLVRLLENWTSATLYINGSFVNLYPSTVATNQYQQPGVYFNAPTRVFSFNQSFLNPAMVPPGTPQFPVAPAITAGPASQIVAVGANVTFSVSASGYENFAYRWSYDSNVIANATNSTLTLTSVQTSQAGYYQALVVDPAGATFSSNAVLTVIQPVVITTQPTNLVVLAGQSASFTVSATGTGPLGYQWLFDGTNIGGGNSSLLSLTNVGAGQAGNYAVLVTNAASSVVSSNAALMVFTTAAAVLDAAPVAVSNQFQFGVSGVPGYKYAVEASTDLMDWVTLFTNTSPFSFVDTNATFLPQRYYRTVYLP